MKYLSLLFFIALSPLLAENDILAPFPEPGEGLVQRVLILPEEENEQDVKVELLVGRIEHTDPVNVKRLAGSFEEKTVEGWGYSYYVAELGPMISTLMAPPEGVEDVDRFVSLPGTLIRYNSRLPVVLHVPEDAVVRYRIWRAGEEQELPDSQN